MQLGKSSGRSRGSAVFHPSSNGLTKMLFSPAIEKVLAELEDYQGTTLGDLLSFMQAFNLRFAPANSYRQKQIYLKLYPMLAEQAPASGGSATGDVSSVATGAVDTVENEGTSIVDGLKSAAVDFFEGMKSRRSCGVTTSPKASLINRSSGQPAKARRLARDPMKAVSTARAPGRPTMPPTGLTRRSV